MSLMYKFRQLFRSNNVLQVREIPKEKIAKLNAGNYNEKLAEARARMNAMGIYEQKPLIKVSRNRRLRIAESEVSPVNLDEA